jgi:DNA-binding SARP family transcriptional activator
MARLSLTLLGGLQARLDGTAVSLPTRKSQALLAYLALTPGQAHPRDKLAALLWGGIREGSARASLRQALFAIRKAAGDGVLRAEGATVTLAPEAAEVDADVLARAVATGSPESLARAADLYKGDLLAGLVVDEAPWEEWVLGERERLRELALEGLAKLLAHQRRSGATEAATQSALRLLALDPLQEPVHRVLMRLYAELGRRGAALRQYQQCVAMLRRDLGTEPEPETQHLYQEILRRPSAHHVAPAAVDRLEHSNAVDGALVGRDAELSTLRAALADAVSGAARMVALVGDAGIGKSRLATAISAEARVKGARVILGRCYDDERMLPFAPWIDGLRRAGIARESDELRALAPVWRAELTRLLPELVAPDLPASGDDPMRLFEAVTRLVEARATGTPLVIVLEDVHWADEISLHLLAYLRRRVHRVRLLILVTARAEEIADTPLLRRTLEDLEHRRRLVPLVLGPLGRDATVALVHALARTGRDTATLDRLGDDVWSASEGNPFMVVETVRAIEQRARGATPRPLTLPERVRHVIADRLDRLRPHARDVTAVAAVIGRDFDFAVLQRASGLAETDAATAVEELVRRRILHGVGERFEFTHDRIREVAHDSMLSPRRRLLHRQVAEAIEALVPDRAVSALALARHYFEAGVWDAAVTYFRRAGSYAMSQSGYHEAVRCLEHALQALRHLAADRDTTEAAVDIRLDLRTALYPLGELERTLAYLREAEPLAEALDDDRRRGRIAAYVCVALRRLGDFDGAIAAGERALSLASAIDDVSLRVATTLYLGQALWFTGSGRRAVEVLRENVNALTAEQLRLRHGAPGYPGVFSLTDMASVLAELGDFAEAKRLGERGLALAEELAQPFTSIAAYLAVADVSIAAGEFAIAIERLDLARALCERGDFPVQRVSIQARFGHACLFVERAAEGLALLEEAVKHVDRVDGFWRPRVLGWLAESYLLHARVDEASRVAERAMAIVPRNAPAVRAWTLRLAAEVASHGTRVDVERAAGLYREAAAFAETLELRPLRAHCHLGLGRLYRAAGDPRARAEMQAAVDAFQAMGGDFWRSIAEPELLKT